MVRPPEQEPTAPLSLMETLSRAKEATRIVAEAGNLADLTTCRASTSLADTKYSEGDQIRVCSSVCRVQPEYRDPVLTDTDLQAGLAIVNLFQIGDRREIPCENFR